MTIKAYYQLQGKIKQKQKRMSMHWKRDYTISLYKQHKQEKSCCTGKEHSFSFFLKD